MEVTHVEPNCREWVTVFSMPPGSYGITKDGDYYFRTSHSAVCLNDYGESYSAVNEHSSCKVRLLPSGSLITIKV